MRARSRSCISFVIDLSQTSSRPEENLLAHDMEPLQFAEARTARSRYHVNKLMKLRDGYADGSTDRDRAEKLLANFEAIHDLMECFCDQLRRKVNSRRG